jgi:hypothetical protein
VGVDGGVEVQVVDMMDDMSIMATERWMVGTTVNERKQGDSDGDETESRGKNTRVNAVLNGRM